MVVGINGMDDALPSSGTATGHGNAGRQQQRQAQPICRWTDSQAALLAENL